jgi:hypothetical protein
MTATVGVATSGSRPELIKEAYRRLRRMGFDAAEATNLTALRNGFGICAQPWTFREVTHLLFLRELDHTGRRWSGADDRVAEDLGEEWRIPQRRTWDVDRTDGRVTLQTLLAAVAGPTAKLERLVPHADRQAGAIDGGQEGGRGH